MIRFFLGNLLRPRLFIVAYFLTSFLSLGSSAPDAADSPAHPEIARSYPSRLGGIYWAQKLGG